MTSAREAGNRALAGLGVVWLLAAAKLALHLATSGQYGYFRDELYFLSCGDRLDWGYVDHPPMVALLARAGRALFGDSVLGLRTLPAIAGAALVLLTGMLTRTLGGGRFAQALACLAVIAAPVLLANHYLMTMNALEPLIWLSAAYLALLAIRSGDGRYWLGFGVLAGLGLQTKYSVLVFGFGVVVGLLLAREGRFLRSPWFWAGGGAALVVFLPNLWWNATHDWPFVQLTLNLRQSGRDIQLAPLPFLGQQLLVMNPFTAPVWLAGLWRLLFTQEGRRDRALGWAFLTLLLTFLLLKGKHYYVAPAYPMLMAAGGVAWERWSAWAGRAWMRPAALATLALGGAAFAPLVIPVLPPDRLVQYLEALPFDVPRTEHNHHRARLPQHLGDQFGWPELVAEVARVYHALPPAERAKAAIFADNYGEAGAIDFFGPRHGLPRAISGHMNYWLWGPRDYSGEVVIVVGSSGHDLPEKFASVERAGRVEHARSMPDEHFDLFVCRGLKAPMAEVWPRIRRWR